MRTCHNPADINRFRSHTDKTVFGHSIVCFEMISFFLVAKLFYYSLCLSDHQPVRNVIFSASIKDRQTIFSKDFSDIYLYISIYLTKSFGYINTKEHKAIC